MYSTMICNTFLIVDSNKQIKFQSLIKYAKVGDLKQMRKCLQKGAYADFAEKNNVRLTAEKCEQEL